MNWSVTILLMANVAIMCCCASAQPPADPYAEILTLRRQMFQLRSDQRAADAIEVCQRVLAAERRIYGDDHAFVGQSLEFIAGLYAANGQVHEAKELRQQQQAVEEKLRAERQRRLDGLEQKSQQAIELAKASRVAEAQSTLASIVYECWTMLDYLAATQPERVQIEFAQAVRIHLDRFLSLASRNQAHADPGYFELSNWKGAAFTRQQRRNLERRNPALAPLYRELANISSRLATLLTGAAGAATHQDQIERLAIRQEQLESEIARRRYRLPQYMPARLEHVLPESVVLIDYYQYQRIPELCGNTDRTDPEPRLAAFVVRSSRKTEEAVVHVDLGPLAPIEEAVRAWRRNIELGGGAIRGDRRVRSSAPPERAKTAPQLALRDLVWRPLDGYLPADATVLISPDGVLGFVPFAALPAMQADRYLVEEWPIAVAPAPRLIQPLRRLSSMGWPGAEAAERPAGLVLVGDVDFDAVRAGGEKNPRRSPFAFAPLPGTRKEITAVEGLFREFRDGEPLDVLAAAAATETALRQAAIQRTWLHLATHGYFHDGPAAGGAGDHPAARSALALAGANVDSGADADDGILTALEAASLDLNHVELAVLSACETNLGELRTGEGVLGLQRAFQAAGCRSTVTSLWKVDDQATQALMVEFYRNLWARKLGKLQALRQAQWAMLRGELYTPPELRNLPDQQTMLPPSYWAAFQLSGEIE